jgi:1,2-phenylacetyl-CoA epoxidase PaaB subunit
VSPNVYNVSYTHAAGSDGSAARGARYITRRPEEREEGKEPTRESGWREIEHVGNKEQFIEEANRRRDEKRERAEESGKDLSKDKSPGSAQYLHVVISPENSERMTDEDFKEIAKEWTRDETGREHPHVGAIHRDSDHDHMHLMIARDKFSKEELGERKEASEEVVRDIERYRGMDREPEREKEPAVRDPERDRGEDRGAQTQQSQERDLER